MLEFLVPCYSRFCYVTSRLSDPPVSDEIECSVFCGKILGVKLVSGNAGVSRVFCENLAAGRSVLSCASQCCDLLKFTSWGCVSVTVGSNFYVCMLLLCRTQNRKHGTLDLPLGCKTELIYGLRIIFFGTLVTNYHVTQKSVGIYLQ